MILSTGALQSVRSCQAKPHFTGQLPGTIAINFVYVWLNRLLFLQIISHFKAVLILTGQLHAKSFATVSKLAKPGITNLY